jgi:hypothetical protein
MERRVAIVAAGLRRFAFILLGLGTFTAAITLTFTALSGSNADRTVAIGFDLVGVFFLVAGFFVGNRGPVRLKGQASVPLFGERRMRWATPEEREDAISDSAIFVAVGIAMIVIGVAIDSRYRLF